MIAQPTRPAPAAPVPLPPAAPRAAGDKGALAVLSVLVALAAANRFAFDTWLARFDLYTFFVPWYAFLGERLRAFDIPGWNPHLFSGTPFAGDPESGWMYLPAMLAFTLFDVLVGFKAMAALHLAVAGLSTYALARKLEMAPPSALVAAVAYALGPLLQWNTYCCLVLAQFAVWIPPLLLGVELSLRARRWRDRLVPWSLAAFALAQMFAGWVGQGWLLGPMLLAAWVGYRALLAPPRPDRELRERLLTGVATGGATLLLGLALGAAGILPRLAVNLQSNLAGADYARQGAAGILNPPWEPGYLLFQILGGGYDQRRAALGGAVVVLALLAPIFAGRRFAVPFFAGLTLVSMILTLDTTPLHRLFYLIPGFQALHEHDAWRVYAVAPIGPALLAGATVEALPAWRGRRRFLPVAAAPLLLVAVAALLLRPLQGFVGWAPLAAAAAATVAILFAIAAPTIAGRQPRSGTRPNRVPLVLLAVVFAQPTGLELTGSWLGWPADPTWQRHWRPDPWVGQSLANEVAPTDPGGAGEFLQARRAESGPFRYVGYGGFGHPDDPGRRENYMARRFDPAVQAILVNGRPMFLGLDEIQGYNPIELARYAEFMAALNGATQDYHTAYLLPSGTGSPLLDLLNVRYALVDAALPADRADVAALIANRREVFRTPAVVVYERDPPRPHAWIVHEVRRVARGEALPLLASGAIDPYRVGLIEGPPPEVAPPPSTSGERTRVVRAEPDALTIEATATAPGLLVVSEVYEAGWRAYVDGEPAAILPTHHLLRGIPLPAGTHTVELRYDPLELRLGLPVSGTAAAAITAILGLAGWRRRPDAAGRGRPRRRSLPRLLGH